MLKVGQSSRKLGNQVTRGEKKNKPQNKNRGEDLLVNNISLESELYVITSNPRYCTFKIN